jgi:hypothetical protein
LVFVGSSYKGTTPYASAWVEAVPSVNYTIVLPGFVPGNLRIRGVPGETVSSSVRLLSGPELTKAAIDAYLEAFRSELAQVGERAEASAGYPRLSKFLSREFRERLQRRQRAAAATDQNAPRFPSSSAEEYGSGYRTAWTPHESLVKEDDVSSWLVGICDFFDGEPVGGYTVIFSFVKENNRWLVGDLVEVGQDHDDDER